MREGYVYPGAFKVRRRVPIDRVSRSFGGASSGDARARRWGAPPWVPRRTASRTGTPRWGSCSCSGSPARTPRGTPRGAGHRAPPSRADGARPRAARGGRDLTRQLRARAGGAGRGAAGGAGGRAGVGGGWCAAGRRERAARRTGRGGSRARWVCGREGEPTEILNVPRRTATSRGAQLQVGRSVVHLDAAGRRQWRAPRRYSSFVSVPTASLADLAHAGGARPPRSRVRSPSRHAAENAARCRRARVLPATRQRLPLRPQPHRLRPRRPRGGVPGARLLRRPPLPRRVPPQLRVRRARRALREEVRPVLGVRKAPGHGARARAGARVHAAPAHRRRATMDAFDKPSGRDERTPLGLRLRRRVVAFRSPSARITPRSSAPPHLPPPLPPRAPPPRSPTAWPRPAF